MIDHIYTQHQMLDYLTTVCKFYNKEKKHFEFAFVDRFKLQV